MLLEVLVNVLESKVEAALSVFDIQQANNVGVLQGLKHGDLTQCSTGDAFVLKFELDLFQGDNFTSRGVASLEDDTISALTKSLCAHVASKAVCHFRRLFWLEKKERVR